MNNADKPAYPTDLDAEYTESGSARKEKKPFTGLTKRERFAMINWSEEEIQSKAKEIARKLNTDDTAFADYVSPYDVGVRIAARVALADALLSELEKEQS